MGENKEKVTDHPVIYRFICWMQKLIRKIRRNLTQAEIELNFLRYKLLFGERDDDIYIVTFPKSGTTLMQMLLYQLTTAGSMHFKHIYDVSPWIRNEAYRGKSPRELTSPRLIKSHDGYDKFDRATKGRFIYVYRNPMDVAVSLYNQRISYGLPKLDFQKFLDHFIHGSKMNWFSFNRKWFENRHKFNILYISYEELLEDFDSALGRIAGFLDINYKTSDKDRIAAHCNFDFMKQHEEKFGVQPPEKPPMVFDQFIRKGKTGEGRRSIPPELQQVFVKQYREKVRPFEQKRANRLIESYF